MTPEQASERARLYSGIRELISRVGADGRDDAARDRMLDELGAYQARWCEPYGRFVAQRPHTSGWPALPCDGFRFARISSRAARDDVRTFESSGTTQGARSHHAYADLSLYDLAARTAARHALFPDCERMQLLILAPPESELASSSLSYMLARFVEWFGADGSTHVWPAAGRELSRLDALLRDAEREARPVALLGTSFAFVHALDGLSGERYALPTGSRVMQTGGFKGRSRELSPEAMRAWLAASFGMSEAHVVAEYGMTELSSQLYETTLREALLGSVASERRLWAPPWLRVTVVHPETLARQPDGDEGLVRLDDPANLDSVAALQTADVGVFRAGGLLLRGRAQGAVARGCSITADELLGGGR
jgi:hypothetical protein